MTRVNSVRMLAVAVIAPLLIVAAAIVAIVVALPELPNPIAVHWGASGAPDGFGSPWLLVATTVFVVVAFGVVCAAVIRSSQLQGSILARGKALLVVGPALAVLLSVLSAGSVLMQRGLEDAANAPSVLPVLLIAGVSAALAGLVAWFFLPKAERYSPQTGDDLPTIDLTTTEKAVWMRRVEPSPWIGSVIVGLLVITTIAGGAGMWATAALASLAIYLVAMIAISVLAAGMLFWRVTVSDAGFSAVSAVGFPRFSYPLSQITSASALNIDPLREFGGWGLRGSGSGRIGIVTRRGESIEVQRSDGKVIVVTVDGATQGAALLNALVAREKLRSHR